MTKTKPMTDEWRDKLHTWIDRQYGTAGWEQKLENLIDSIITQATSKAREEVAIKAVKLLSKKPPCTEDSPCGCHFGQTFHADGMCSCDLVQSLKKDK